MNNRDVDDDVFRFDNEYTVNGMTIAVCDSMYLFTGLVELIELNLGSSETVLIYSSSYLSVSLGLMESYLITQYLRDHGYVQRPVMSLRDKHDWLNSYTAISQFYRLSTAMI